MALTAYQKAMNKALNKQPSYYNPLLELAQQGATAGATPTTGAANTGNLTAAQIQSLREDAQRSAATAQAVSNAKTTAERNAILRQSAQQNAAKQGVPGAEQILATEQALQQKAPGVSLTQQPTAQQTAFQAYLESAAPQEQYLWRNMGENEMYTMNEGEQRLWQNAMQGYANGDYSAFNRDFQKAGNWGSYVDANGKVSGMLRYAGDGVGGYVPINNGKLMQNGFSGDIKNYAFYGPNGEVYTADANGNLFKTGTWTDQYDSVMKNGYYKNDVNDYGDRMFIGKDGQAYTYNNVPDEKLAEWGYVRRNGGIFYEPETIARNSPDGTWMQNNPLYNPGGNNGGNTTGGNTPTGQRGSAEYTDRVTTQPTNPASTQPQPTQPVQTQPTPNIYQQYMDQWDYPEAPEWNGSEYEQRRDEALEAAGERWQGSEYQPRRDAALERAENMQWNYDPNTDPVWQALQKQYRREGDRATQEALAQAAMRTGGLANSYAVTAASQAGDYYAAQLSDRLPQVYQDAYNRYLQEFQRQMGISDQYQGFDDREYSRWADQQGRNFDVADRYNQYGEQDYDKYRDRLGQYNTDRSFDYGRYRDRISDARYADETAYDRQRDAISDQRYDQEWAQQLREYADEQNWKATEWQQYLREYGDQLSEQERQWAYQMARDAESDRRYNDETAYQRAMYADETAYDRGYKQTVYQNELSEADDKRYKDGLSLWSQLGVLPDRYADIVGYPAGTRWEDVFGGMDADEAYSGGGNPGYTPSPKSPSPSDTPPIDTPPGDNPPDDTTPDNTGNGRTWWNGRPMTDTAYDLQSRIAYGWAQKTLTKDNVQRMVYDAARKGYIEDYEIPLLMRIIGVNIQGPSQQNPNVEGPITQWTK